MHWRISPSLIKETSCAIQVVEIILISFTPPKTHIGDFEIAPEMAGRVSLRFDIMLWSSGAVRKPIHSIIVGKIFWVFGDEFDRFGPECRYRFGRIVEIYCEAVGFVMVLHVAEYIVVDVAEEMGFRFHAPVELHVC